MAFLTQKKLTGKPFKSFLLIFLLLGSMLGGLALFFYQQQVHNYTRRLFAEEQYTVNLQHEIARNHFTSIYSDLTFLAGQEDIKTYLAEFSELSRNGLNNEYLIFSASKTIYDQIRHLDEAGQEMVRVNYNNGTPTVVAQDQLQNKSERYYFSEAFRLDRGEFFVSPLDLNIEHGLVEIPYKPMIRFGTPVFDSAGNKRGIVLLNYLATHLLQAIREVGKVAHGQTMLLNADGYWLQHPDSNKEWGFMFADKARHGFAAQYPQVWSQMLETPSGQLDTPQGIFTFATIHPLGLNVIFAKGAAYNYLPSEGYFWKIVSFISAESLDAYSAGLFTNLYGLATGLILLTITGSWVLATTLARRKLYHVELLSLAHFDNLTGLPNRTLFFDRLQQAINTAKRYARNCALLYVDLDGFKKVNDVFGHAGGDAVLIAVGKRMVECCRSSDTVVRLGGDEFAVLLTEISDVESVKVVTEKILASLQESYCLAQGRAEIGGSIGIALFPEHGGSLEQLIRSADAAMYRAKHEGKNRYQLAE